MKSVFIFSIFLLQLLKGYSQVSFQKTFGSTKGEICYDVIQTFDGGYLFLNKQINLYIDSTDILLIKTNELGDTLWTSIIGQANEDVGMSLIQTSDSGFAIAGYTKSFGLNFYHLLLIKINNTGNILWTKLYGNNIGNFRALDIVETPENNLLITGEGPLILHSVILLKTDSLGNLIWQKTYGRGRGVSLCVTSDGSYVIVGYGTIGSTASDIYVVKTDSSGTPIWNKLFGSPGDEEAKSIYQTSDYGYIISGESRGMGIGDIDIFLLKLDSLGNFNWVRGFGNFYQDHGGYVCPTLDGGYLVGGSTLDSINNDYEILLVKTNSSGDTVWTKSYGGNSDDFLFTIKQVSDGGLISGGYSRSFVLNNTHADLYIIKMDSSLNSGCNRRNSTTTVSIPTLITGSNTLTSMNIGGVLDQFMQISNGCTQLNLCNNLSIDEFKPKQILIIYPNPSDGRFKISLDPIIKIGELNIYNQLGQCIFSSKITDESNLHVDLSSQSQGVYFLEFKDEHNTLYGKVNIVYN